MVGGAIYARCQKLLSVNIQLNDYRRAGKQDKKLPLVAPLRDVRIHFNSARNWWLWLSIPVGLASEFIEQGESAFVIMGDQFFWRGDGGSNAADLAGWWNRVDCRLGY